MNRRRFLGIVPMAWSLLSINSHAMNRTKSKPAVQLIRHATLLIQFNDLKILVDPMLSPREALDPVANSSNPVRFPMVDLPMSENQLKTLLTAIDAVFVTHLHRDHWDVSAQHQIDKNTPVFCQPADAEKIRAQGFFNVTGIDDTLVFRGITIHRTNGKHGTGEIGQKMGDVSGFVFVEEQKKIYVAGDTIWCDDVEAALKTHQPTTTIVNAGAAQFLTGDAITMTPADVIKTKLALPKTQLVAVHMDTVNHCHVKRNDLRKEIENSSIEIHIPNDGEWLSFA